MIVITFISGKAASIIKNYFYATQASAFRLPYGFTHYTVLTNNWQKLTRFWFQFGDMVVLELMVYLLLAVMGSC